MDSRGTPANWRPSAISGHLLTTIRQLFPTLVLISGPSLPPQKIQPSTQDRINPWITDKNMASRKFIPYSQPKNVPDSIITLYAQPKSIPSSRFHLIWPAKDHTLFSPHMASQRPYPISSHMSSRRVQLFVRAVTLTTSWFIFTLMSTSILITFMSMFIVPGRHFYRMFPLFSTTSGDPTPSTRLQEVR